jgi:carboxymethylenebutenolidase
MGEQIELLASDGFRGSAYRASPDGVSTGSIVVIQEIFGVNAHVRDICDRFASAGYAAIAPALFDRLRPGVELDYNEAGVAEGRALVAELGWDAPMLDIAAAASVLRPDNKVGVVGYCWGGTVAWLAACKLNVAGAACYYGRQIIDFVALQPRCPVIMHFGADDALIPLATVDAIKAAHPDVPIFVYEGAGHGFNCDRRADFRPEVAGLALQRTRDFFRQHLPSGAP